MMPLRAARRVPGRRSVLRRDAEDHLLRQLSFRLQPVRQSRTVAPPALFVKFVRAKADSFFHVVEAGVQPAEKRLPLLKCQKRRKLSPALRRLPVDPKCRKNPFFARFNLAQNQKERIIAIVASWPSSQSNRSRDCKAGLLFIRIARKCAVDSVLQRLSAFLANADGTPFCDGNGGVVNRDSLHGMIIGTTYSRRHNFNLLATHLPAAVEYKKFTSKLPPQRVPRAVFLLPFGDPGPFAW